MDSLEKTKREFEEAYDQFADALFRHCFFKVSDREKAKDLVQETFIKTWNYLASGKEVRNIKTFLYKVAGNLIIDHYRKVKDFSLDQLTEKGFDFSKTGDEIVNSAEYSRVLSFLAELEEKYREVIVWRFIDGLSPKEIAEIVGVSENVVSVRLNRAVKKLKEKTVPEQL